MSGTFVSLRGMERREYGAGGLGTEARRSVHRVLRVRHGAAESGTSPDYVMCRPAYCD